MLNQANGMGIRLFLVTVPDRPKAMFFWTWLRHTKPAQLALAAQFMASLAPALVWREGGLSGAR